MRRSLPPSLPPPLCLSASQVGLQTKGAHILGVVSARPVVLGSAERALSAEGAAVRGAMVACAAGLLTSLCPPCPHPFLLLLLI